ncbi:MAG: sulfur carrier protein ThiS [Oscillospiraceae bacterium]|nr:sulfur carrier protein ThiS [Oscillospiraceae bacterium]
MTGQTIMLNNRVYPYTEGLTITSLLAENRYGFSHIIAKINGKVIEDELWPDAKVSAGDNVELIHVFGGG